MRVNAGDAELFVREVGEGPEAVVLSHSYLVDHRQFDAQIAALSGEHRVVAYDQRDHGQSDRAGKGYDLDTLVSDAEAVIDQLSAAPCHFVGLSTGGFVGMRLAVRRPEQLRSLTLMDTSAERETWFQRAKYRALLTVLGIAGTGPVLRSAMSAMFSRTFLRDPEKQDEVAIWRQRIGGEDADALIRFGKAIFAREEFVDQLRELELPTLVLVGAQDRSLPPRHSRTIADTVPGAQLVVIPDAGHLSTIEQPDAVNEVLLPFIHQHSQAPR